MIFSCKPGLSQRALGDHREAVAERETHRLWRRQGIVAAAACVILYLAMLANEPSSLDEPGISGIVNVETVAPGSVRAVPFVPMPCDGFRSDPAWPTNAGLVLE